MVCASASRVEPFLDLVRIEAQKTTPFEKRDSSLGDEPADVAMVHTEPCGDGGSAWVPRWVGVDAPRRWLHRSGDGS